VPPDFRRLASGSTEIKPPADRPAADDPTGGVAAAQPLADRPATGAPTGGAAAAQPPAQASPMPGPDPVVTSQFPGNLPAPAQPLSRPPLRTLRRQIVGDTGAKAGLPPSNALNVFPAYPLR